MQRPVENEKTYTQTPAGNRRQQQATHNIYIHQNTAGRKQQRQRCKAKQSKQQIIAGKGDRRAYIPRQATRANHSKSWQATQTHKSEAYRATTTETPQNRVRNTKRTQQSLQEQRQQTQLSASSGNGKHSKSTKISRYLVPVPGDRRVTTTAMTTAPNKHRKQTGTQHATNTRCKYPSDNK